MGNLRNYFFGKLSVINYKMAIHEGNANRRLASQSDKLLVLPESEVPDRFRTKFIQLIDLIKSTKKTMPVPGLQPTRLGRITNRTASNYLKLLFEIEDEMRDE